jgi:uncharacterized protein (DUF2147 family)
MKTIRLTLLSILLIIVATRPAAADPVYPADAVIGIWETEHTENGWSHVEIFAREGKYHGRIVWLSEPVYKPDDTMAGQPVVDRENPDASLRGRSLVGLEIMRGFLHDGEHKWTDGRIYDPESGKEYRCKITMKDPDTLEIFGYVKVGFVKLGRNTTWTRVEEE